MGNKYFIKNIGLIKASGKDFIDFMNRMSTNDFKKFSLDESRKTILTTDKGRIVDLINILNFANQPIILSSQNFQDKIINHLNKYIIMDDVGLEKVNEEYCNIIITGQDLSGLAKNIFQINIENNKAHRINEDEYLFYDDFKFESINIICKRNNIDKYKDKLKDLVQMKCEEYEYFRIEAGLPEGENEFNDQINPMECWLDKYISYTKGCYIGQEVIARLDTQGKRPKQMIKINSDEQISKDDKIYLDDKEAGVISSVINHNGNYSALGFIRSIYLDFEKSYSAEHDNKRFKIDISSVGFTTEKIK